MYLVCLHFRRPFPVLFPQALVNPLSVAVKSPKADRKAAADKLMHHMKHHASVLVEVCTGTVPYVTLRYLTLPYVTLRYVTLP